LREGAVALFLSFSDVTSSVTLSVFELLSQVQAALLLTFVLLACLQLAIYKFAKA
jgi:hypothetical protein